MHDEPLAFLAFASEPEKKMRLQSIFHVFIWDNKRNEIQEKNFSSVLSTTRTSIREVSYADVRGRKVEQWNRGIGPQALTSSFRRSQTF